MKISLKKSIVLSAVFLLVLIALLTVKTPYTIKAPCRIIAQNEWTLTQIQPDKLSAELVKNDSNIVKYFSLLQFDRQDFVEFSMAPHVFQGMSVNSGDVIGNMVSSENRLLLVELKGELEKAKASLLSLSTGEKEALQAEAEQAIKYTKAEL
jgi:xanthine/uracil/vitamin C permease (AzgA family)